MTSDIDIPTVQLHDGRALPQLGFGTFQIPPEDTERAVSEALEVGYRHLDTAQMYANEKEVGRAIETSGIPRQDIWVTTKLTNSAHLVSDAREMTTKSVEALGEIDLYLVHWPLAMYADVTEVWRVMVELAEEFPIKGIGVSNFQPDHLDRIVESGMVKPLVNQIESNPYFPNDTAREHGANAGIVTEAWSPLAQGRVFDDEQLAKIAGDVGRTVSQVVLRWALQRGDVVFPKSLKAERMRENMQLFDFELTDDQMGQITALEDGTRSGPDPDTFDWRG